MSSKISEICFIFGLSLASLLQHDLSVSRNDVGVAGGGVG